MGSNPKKWATLENPVFLRCLSFFPHEMAESEIYVFAKREEKF